MEIPSDLKFTKDHEWVRIEGGGVVAVGITHFAQDALGDIVYVEVPDVGDPVETGGEFGVVESVKAVSDVYAPVAGEVVEVNLALEDAPELVNESPYEDGWILKIKMSDEGELDNLMDAEDYRELLDSE